MDRIERRGGKPQITENDALAIKLVEIAGFARTATVANLAWPPETHRSYGTKKRIQVLAERGLLTKTSIPGHISAVAPGYINPAMVKKMLEDGELLERGEMTIKCMTDLGSLGIPITSISNRHDVTEKWLEGANNHKKMVEPMIRFGVEYNGYRHIVFVLKRTRGERMKHLARRLSQASKAIHTMGSFVYWVCVSNENITEWLISEVVDVDSAAWINVIPYDRLAEAVQAESDPINSWLLQTMHALESVYGTPQAHGLPENAIPHFRHGPMINTALAINASTGAADAYSAVRNYSPAREHLPEKTELIVAVRDVAQLIQLLKADGFEPQEAYPTQAALIRFVTLNDGKLLSWKEALAALDKQRKQKKLKVRKKYAYFEDEIDELL